MQFLERDLETDDEGEILVENGDFVLAEAERTAIQLVSFLLLTDFGDYTPQPRACANLGEFIGAMNISRTHNLMRTNAYAGAEIQGTLGKENLDIIIEALEDEVAGVIVRIKADFGKSALDDDYGNPILGFKFPFPTAELERVDLDG